MGSNQVGSDSILFLHGFWGQSSDWDFLKTYGLSKAFEAPSYLKDPVLGPENALSDWGQNFLNWKRAKWGEKRVTAVGYSQGGRLLLQAFSASPEDFNKLILISSHPGLIAVSEKEQRLIQDRQWARKFRTLDWLTLQGEWDMQGVFQSNQGPLRHEKDHDRERLALCFENWSLAHQQDFRDLINDNPSKVHVIVGEQDLKYVELYRDFLKDFEALIIEKGAAHRVPFDQPAKLVETLNSII